MYHFIVNPGAASGKCKNTWLQLEKELIAREIAYDVAFTEKASVNPNASISALAALIEEKCAQEGSDCTIVLLGGDGSLNEVIQEIKHPEQVTFGYIPSGSGNDFGHAVGIPFDAKEAFERMLAVKEPTPIDIGELIYHDYDESTLMVAPEDMKPCRRFLISSGIGFDAATCELSMESGKKSFLNRLHLGKLIYLVNAIHLLTHLECLPASIQVNDDPPQKIEKFVLGVAMNTKYEGGGFMFCPDADPSDQKLSICLAKDLTFGRILPLLVKIPKGKHTDSPSISLITGERVRIKTDLPMWVHTDGEVMVMASDVEMNCCKYRTKFLL